MNEIYLDYAATTPPLQEVADVVAQTMISSYGNPSSLHKKGIEAEKKLKESTTYFAQILGCKEEEIIYTSGGTESNNMAIIGTAMAYKRTAPKLITTTIEHPSVGDVFTYLETQGFEVLRLGVDEKGYIDYDQLSEALDEQTALVSIMHVNNEVGTIQDLERIGKLIKTKSPKTLFHVDAIQGFCKLPIHVKAMHIDLLSISGHKFYGPRGVGMLYKTKEARLIPTLYGGGQQKGVRSGTENVPGIMGMYVAARWCQQNLTAQKEHLYSMKKYMWEQINNKIEDVKCNGPSIEEGAPHILNVSFKNIKAEVLLHALEQYHIYVSSGSACSSNKVTTSKTLRSIGNTDENLDNAIRFSFGHQTTKEAIETAVEVLQKQVTLLRKFTPGGKKR